MALDQQRNILMPSPCPYQSNNPLARKSSDSSCSELTAQEQEDGGCGCVMNFLHLRPHTDAIMDCNIKNEDCSLDDDMIMIKNTGLSESVDASNDTKKSPLTHDQKETSPPYQSPPPKDVESRRSSATTPPALPKKSSDSMDIVTNEPPSAETLSAELHPSEVLSMSIPTLQFAPNSVQHSHLISTTNDDDDDAPLLSLDIPNEGRENLNMLISRIPRINLRMRNRHETRHHLVAESNRSLNHVSQQAMDTSRQSAVIDSRFVPIQQDEDDEEL